MLFTVSLQIRLNSIMLHRDVIGFCVVARFPPQQSKNIGLIIRQSRTSLSLVDVSVRRSVRSVPVGDVVRQLLLVVTFRLHHLCSLIPPQMHINSQLIHVQWHCNAYCSPTSSYGNVVSRASRTCVQDGICRTVSLFQRISCNRI